MTSQGQDCQGGQARPAWRRDKGTSRAVDEFAKKLSLVLEKASAVNYTVSMAIPTAFYAVRNERVEVIHGGPNRSRRGAP